MAKPRSVWGIDIGQVALKAIKLRSVDGELQVEAFDIVEHAKILSEPDADRRQLIRGALEQFLARNNVSDSSIAVAVPGQSSFTRFVKLPPVESKKVPDIVRYEAEQQIPFPIDDVIWRWQTFIDPDSPDIEVGIFAMKRLDVYDMLDRFTDVGLNVDFVQMAPLALYNFLTYDGQLSPEGATLLVDVGADKTDLVVADGPRMWTRTLQIGGNNFTESLVRAFKLPFPKAENLKRTATTSKYAKQVFQAMRPVFADLVQEIQRSIGFYTALHRDTRFKKIVGLGNGFRLPGLQKFLEQNLNISVVPVDTYNKVTPSQSVSAPQFTENVLSLAVAYGLAVQGLGNTAVQTNLLPQEIATRRIWAKKRFWFAASAAALLVALASPIFDDHRVSTMMGQEANQANFNQAKVLVDEQQRNRSQRDSLGNQIDQQKQEIDRYMGLFKYRVLWPTLQSVVWDSLSDPQVAPDQDLYKAYIHATGEEARKTALAAIKAKKRADRQVFMIDRLTVDYNPYVDTLSLSESGTGSGNASGQPRPGFRITLVGRTPMQDQGLVNDRLAQGVQKISSELAQKNNQFKIQQFSVIKIEKVLAAASGAPGATGRATESSSKINMPDPLLPEEDMANDTQFTIGWIVAPVEEKPQTKTAGKAPKAGAVH